MAANSVHIDKKLPLASLLGFGGFLLVQTITLIYVGAIWKAQTDARIEAVEKSVSMFSSYVQRNDENTGRSIDRFARLEEKFTSMDNKLGDIVAELRSIRKQ